MPTTHIRAAMTGMFLVTVVATRAWGFSGGVTTQNFGALGCNQCHSGGQVPTVQLLGPTSVTPNSINEYTLRITAIGAQTRGGLNVSSPTGALATGGANAGTTQAPSVGGRRQITHTTSKLATAGVVTFSFLWTAPSVFTSATLNAWGNAVNGVNGSGGDRAAFVALTITSDGPTPTATLTPTASITPTPSLTPSPLPSSTPTSTATSTPEPTLTSTETPSATITPTLEPTPTPVPCVGDCNRSRTVTVAELVAGVNIALGIAELRICAAFDADGNDMVTVDELVAAVNAALTGCGPP